MFLGDPHCREMYRARVLQFAFIISFQFGWFEKCTAEFFFTKYHLDLRNTLHVFGKCFVHITRAILDDQVEQRIIFEKMQCFIIQINIYNHAIIL